MDWSAFAVMLLNLFLVIDPVGCMPLVVTITKDNTPRERHRMVLKATVIAFLVLVFFAVIGRALLTHFGISVAAVKIAGGFLLFGIGAEMLYGRISGTETTKVEEKEAMEKEDVSITPLAIPLLAGPGSIAAVMLFTSTGTYATGTTIVITALAAILIISYVMLSLSHVLFKYLGTIGLKVTARVMGLLLVFMSAQLVLDGLKLAGFVG